MAHTYENTLGIPFYGLKRQQNRCGGRLVLLKNEPFFFIVKKGTFAKTELQEQKIKGNKNAIKVNKNKDEEYPTRIHALKVIQSHSDQADRLLATILKTGRELYQLKDEHNQLYMVGSMGCVSSLGLGLSLAKKDKKVIAIDGDGAILMRMGCLATNGYNNQSNLLHILLDNQTHDSTGGQFTVSHNVQFVDIAACGYQKAAYVHSLAELDTCIEEWEHGQKLTFLHLKIAKVCLMSLAGQRLNHLK